jgi:hypothetical protein
MLRADKTSVKERTLRHFFVCTLCFQSLCSTVSGLLFCYYFTWICTGVVGVQDAGKSGMHKKKRARLDDVLESGEPLKKMLSK